MPGFLARYRRGEPGALEFLAVGHGFLRLVREEDEGWLERVEFVREATEDALPVGEQLELELSDGAWPEQATFIERNAISGLQWEGGVVRWGHTLDDEGPGAARGERVGLDAWVDRCVARMIARGQEAAPARPSPARRRKR